MWSLFVLAGTVGWILLRKRRAGLRFYEFVALQGSRFYASVWHRWSMRGRSPFLEPGPAIVISNHTCSADPTFLLAASPRPLSFLVAQEHYRVHPFIGALLDQIECVPVRRAEADPLALRQSLRRLGEGKIVVIFPEGGLSGVGCGRMRRGKLGMAFLALVSRAPVYPVFITGGPHTDKLLPSWLWPSWLWPSRRSVRVYFGRPVDLSAYYGRPRTRQVIEEVADMLMHSITQVGSTRHPKGVSS